MEKKIPKSAVWIVKKVKSIFSVNINFLKISSTDYSYSY